MIQVSSAVEKAFGMFFPGIDTAKTEQKAKTEEIVQEIKSEGYNNQNVVIRFKNKRVLSLKVTWSPGLPSENPADTFESIDLRGPVDDDKLLCTLWVNDVSGIIFSARNGTGLGPKDLKEYFDKAYQYIEIKNWSEFNPKIHNALDICASKAMILQSPNLESYGFS